MNYKEPHNKLTCLTIVKGGRAGFMYRKGKDWYVTTFKRKRKLKEFTIYNGLRNVV